MSKPCCQPIPCLLPQNTQAAGSLAAKSELINIFNMSQANNNQRYKRGATNADILTWHYSKNTQSRTKK
ncbi:hypothetical protein AG1IA_09910 [Rhizoctonia solani AG-1 IA]|uniref:Uncharacterized protein n=1 Tax=Thanatephorus cucumeris (strain AG1-IA) TaxID=983506 RepID=L8WD00_THACA|nr:hypothetical protein AG1IA_09910 [Rhizoctonia solani AG-1 IA]